MFFRRVATLMRSLLTLDSMWLSTSAAKRGETGQPCEKPSLTGITSQLPSSLRTRVRPSSWQSMSANACNSGNSVDMISRHFSRDTELNMLVISSETSEREGVLPFCSGSEMYLSTPKRIELTTKSTPPLTPSAKLKGNRCSAKMALCTSGSRTLL